MIWISKYIAGKSNILEKSLLFIGKNSLYALCVHYTEARAINWNILEDMLGKYNIESAYWVILPCKLLIIAIGIWAINKIGLCMKKK